MSQAQALYKLQEIDLEILKRERRIAEINTQLADTQAINTAQSHLESTEAHLVPIRRRARDLEFEINTITEKSATTEDQLYSGKVKNPKEMSDMQQELVALKNRREELEEALLEAMYEIETGDQNIQSAQQGLSAAQTDTADRNKQLENEKSTLQQENENYRTRRESALKDIAPESLTKYNAIRPKKNNQAVAVLSGDSCTSCGVEQTKAIVREAQLGQSLVNCLSCGRILVYRV